MKQQNRFAVGRKHRGRPEAPLEIQIEFIHTEDANERWEKIFELLEAETLERTDPQTENSEDSHCTQ